MHSKRSVEVGGTIGAIMPSDQFTVITDDGDSVLANLSRRVSRQAGSIRVGDRVTVQVSIDLPVPGRIVELAPPVAPVGTPSEAATRAEPNGESAPVVMGQITKRLQGDDFRVAVPGVGLIRARLHARLRESANRMQIGDSVRVELVDGPGVPCIVESESSARGGALEFTNPRVVR